MVVLFIKTNNQSTEYIYHDSLQAHVIEGIAVISVESAVKYRFVFKGVQTRQKGQYNAELTLLSRLCVKLLITPITATGNTPFPQSGHMVQNCTCWDTSCTVGLSKQSYSYQSTLTCLFKQLL